MIKMIIEAARIKEAGHVARGRFKGVNIEAFRGLLDIKSSAKLVARAGLLFSPGASGPTGFAVEIAEAFEKKPPQLDSRRGESG